MNFKKLDLEDKDLIEKYIYPYKFLSCEYSFLTLYIWKDACDVQYAIYKDILIIKKKDFQGKYHFMQPIGYSKENLKETIELLKKYKDENKMDYLFKDTEENFVYEIKELFNKISDLSIKEDRDNFDYLYEAKKLMSFSGKKLHKKKNHYNFFVKNYHYKVVEINTEKIGRDVIQIAERWYDECEEKDYKLYFELQAIKNLINNMNKLKFNGIAVYVDGKLCGFSLGEKLNEKLAVIHIEKGDTNVQGIYSFITKTLIGECFSNVDIINREQDLGIEGLRKSKMSYYPLRFEKKFILCY